MKIENTALRLYLTNKKRKNTNELTQKIKNKKHNRQLPEVTKSQTTIYKTACISSINAHVLPAMEQQMKLIEIDSRRMQILISRAKGKKDRYVNLSPVLLDILRNYIKGSNPRPTEYLFESDQKNTAYPVCTIQQIFSTAKDKAGIKKDVGIHSLRHSFATHLLEKGTDIRYIKDLLGHFDIRTTERYLHVSKKQLVNIVSPFDDLWKKEGIDW